MEHIIGSIGARAIDAFGIDVTRLHWDMTSISLYGAYDSVDADHPAPAYGHPKDRRTDLKQIQAGIGVAADGGIPVFHRAYDGGAGEVAQVVDTMNALKAMAGPRSFLLVGDSKLISYTNVTAMVDAGVTFIAPLAAARVPAGLFAGIDRAAATPVDYIAERDEDKLPWQRGAYRVTEDVMILSGPRKKDSVHQLRRILVHSTANADAAGKARTLKLAQARTELDTLTRTAGTRYHPTVQAVTAKAAEIARPLYPSMFRHQDGLILVVDKGYRDRATETWLNEADISVVRPAYRNETPRPGRMLLRAVRQTIESVNDTLKDDMSGSLPRSAHD